MFNFKVPGLAITVFVFAFLLIKISLQLNHPKGNNAGERAEALETLDFGEKRAHTRIKIFREKVW